MDVRIGIIEIKESRRGSYITILVPISLSFRVVASDHQIGSEVKLPAVVEQRSCYVLLDDQGSFFILPGTFGYSFLDILQLIGAFDAITSVGKLSRLDNPKIIFFVFFL